MNKNRYHGRHAVCGHVRRGGRPRQGPPAPAPPASYVSSFNGLYIGGNVDYGFSKFDANASGPVDSASSTQSA
jgi:hypothetical protein